MKVNLFFACMLTLLVMACKSKTTMTAKQYSDEVTKLEESLSEPIRKAENAIKLLADSSNYKGVTDTAATMESLIQEKIDRLEQIDVSKFAGGDDFKTVAIRYFDYFKSVYTAYKAIGEASDQAARIKASDEMNRILSAQEEVMARMQNSQVRFAAENGFALEEPVPTQPSAPENQKKNIAK